MQQSWPGSPASRTPCVTPLTGPPSSILLLQKPHQQLTRRRTPAQPRTPLALAALSRRRPSETLVAYVRRALRARGGAGEGADEFAESRLFRRDRDRNWLRGSHSTGRALEGRERRCRWGSNTKTTNSVSYFELEFVTFVTFTKDSGVISPFSCSLLVHPQTTLALI